MRGASVTGDGTGVAWWRGMNDNYPGPQTAAPLTDREMEIAGLLDAITRLDERAQDAEDNENLRKASRLREEMRGLKQKLGVLRGQVVT